MKHKEVLERLRAGEKRVEFEECGLPWSIESAQDDKTWAVWQGKQLQVLLAALPNAIQLEELCAHLIAHRIHDQ